MAARKTKVTVTVTQTAYQDVTCDRCGSALPEQSLLPEGSLQRRDALIVRLTGGYGMLIDDHDHDPAYDPRYDRILCHDCGHWLATQLAWDLDSLHRCSPKQPPARAAGSPARQ